MFPQCFSLHLVARKCTVLFSLICLCALSPQVSLSSSQPQQQNSVRLDITVVLPDDTDGDTIDEFAVRPPVVYGEDFSSRHCS